MTRVVRQSRIVRKNQVLSNFVERKAELKEATIDYEKAYDKLKVEAKRILDLYVPLKNAVSTSRWNNKKIENIKVKNGGKTIELSLATSGMYGYDHRSYWKFPSWMIGSTDERIVEGLNKIIQEDATRFAQYELDRLEVIRLKELAKLEELKSKYPETNN